MVTEQIEPWRHRREKPSSSDSARCRTSEQNGAEREVQLVDQTLFEQGEHELASPFDQDLGAATRLQNLDHRRQVDPPR